MTAADEFEDYLDLARQLLTGSEEIADLWEANELVNQALSLRPQDPAAWLLKAQVLLQLDDAVAAFSAVEMALRQAPKEAEAHYVRATALSQMGRYDEALSAITRAFFLVGTCPDDEVLMEELFYEKGAILDAQGRSDEAMATFEEGLSLYPDSELLKAGLAPLRRRNFQVLDGGLA
jgi:tetratricopeptide (TPR) repeat protein